MARYVVESANILVYNDGENRTPETQIGTMPAGTEFYAYDALNYENVKVITYCSDYQEFTGKYVYQVETADGYNFVTESTSDDSGSTGDGGSTGGDDTGGGTSDDPENPGDDSIPEADGGETSADNTIEDFNMPDEFTEAYTGLITSDDYRKSLAEGLQIRDIRGVLGAPHQFLPTADVRTSPTNELANEWLGRVYSEKILKAMPVLLITPGVPVFMSGFSKAQKETVIENLLFGKSSLFDELITNSLEGNQYNGKYYSLQFAYDDYFKYVNGMLRAAAIFLNIQDEEVDGRKLGEYNWLYDARDTETDDTGDVNSWRNRGFAKLLGPYAGAIAFYADCGNQVNDSFSNATTTSQLASTLNSLSDTGRELNFLIGNIGSTLGLELSNLTGAEDLASNIDNVKDAVNDIMGGSNIMSNILGKAKTILAGGRLLFPEIWSDSSFGRSYNCNMKLVSPAGDKLSIFLNILVPIYHLLGMCLPRQSIQQSYFSPFLLRCYYKGLFNVDMGLMTSLSITKGAEGEWTIDGIPTVAEVSFEIKDLYEGLFMSKSDDISDMGILTNITELDYIGNSCGININDQEVSRMAKMYWYLGFDPNNVIKDAVFSNVFGNLSQFFNQQMNNLFGVF